MGCKDAFAIQKRLRRRRVGFEALSIRFRRKKRQSGSNALEDVSQPNQSNLGEHSVHPSSAVSHTSPDSPILQDSRNATVNTDENTSGRRRTEPIIFTRESQQARTLKQLPRRICSRCKKAILKFIPNSIMEASSAAWNTITHTKPSITITLHSDQPSYGTWDEISGEVTVTVKSNTNFDDLEISLTGLTKTFVDKISHSATITGRSEATHRFLKLSQPMSDLPSSRTFEAGQIYKYPFTFVIPAQLLPRACSHQTVSNHIREHHLSLPPTLNEKGVDDLTPDQTKCGYTIEARITKYKDDGKKTIVSESSEKLRIRPTTEEFPPLDTDGDDVYCLRKERVIRKRLIQGRLGTLIMETAQPKSFQLPRSGVEEAATTYARVKLRFDPETEAAEPPKLSTLSSKIKISTFYATTCRSDYPKKVNQLSDLTCDSFHTSMSLSSYSIPTVDWTKHNKQMQQVNRPESALSAASTASATSNTDGALAPSQSYRDGIYYTAEVIVPLSLSSKKTFLPTFHSCLISRVYTLYLHLTLHGHRFSSPLTLKVPVQVSARGSAEGAERQRLARLEEQAAVDAEAAFEPRYVGPTTSTLVDNDIGRVETTNIPDLPPGYGAPGFGAGARNLRVFG